MDTLRLPAGHISTRSLTSRIKIANPINIKSPAGQETWPEYLRMQYPGATIIYDSGPFGDVEIRLPPHPSEEGAALLAHYLWDSSLLLSQLITDSAQHKHDPRWSVQGLEVLELGSGTGLVGIMCALADAKRAVLTDYPSSEVFENIRRNIETNMVSRQQASSLKGLTKVSVQAHKWGDLHEDFAKSNAHKFTRVLATGCLWLPEQHKNIAASMAHFLAKSEKAEIWAVSGFFLGREKLARFFDIALGKGLDVKEVFEQNAVGARRGWMVNRGVEHEKDTLEQGWLLVIVLGQRQSEAQ